jgi:ABC-type sugar transport system ATPase subunit
MTAGQNISLACLDWLNRLGFVRRKAEHEIVSKYFSRLAVRAPGPDTAAIGLSGGNQQKLVLAKWLARNCDILIFDEPTRGVDVGVKSEIHKLIDQIASNGCAVILISSELPEILNLSTRMLVLRRGRLVGELSREEATQERVMQLMAGLNTGKDNNG